MCTLIVGIDVLGPGSIVVAANRDEDPARPSDPPGVLVEHPRLVGGRDRVAGGTWLAVRERQAVVAMLNRRDDGAGPAATTRRSRGLLALAVAGVAAEASSDPGSGLGTAALQRARALLREADYGPLSLVFLSATSRWVLAHVPATEPRVTPIPRGWHVLTHEDLDDAREPRTTRLLGELSGWRPTSTDEVERGLIERLSEHGGPASGSGSPDAPAVCIHQGRMVTVSASLIVLAPSGARYRHAEGRPCEHSLLDLSGLLLGAGPALECA